VCISLSSKCSWLEKPIEELAPPGGGLSFLLYLGWVKSTRNKVHLGSSYELIGSAMAFVLRPRAYLCTLNELPSDERNDIDRDTDVSSDKVGGRPVAFEEHLETGNQGDDYLSGMKDL
jgi:hypothetical protein